MKQIWIERLLRWHQNVQRALIGRYARMDQLNRMLAIVSLFLIVINIFLPNSIVFWLAVAIWLWSNYRFFSKKIYVRLNENTRYVGKQQQIIKYMKLKKAMITNLRTHRYFKCPTCKQSLRAPRGRGKIKITCSACKNHFYKVV
jgi:predicted membrane protein